MPKTIALDDSTDREYAENLWRDLSNAADGAPGWLRDESRVEDVINRLERALDAYDRKHEEED
jgi:hypothetical protein